MSQNSKNKGLWAIVAVAVVAVGGIMSYLSKNVENTPVSGEGVSIESPIAQEKAENSTCLLYTSDAADE